MDTEELEKHLKRESKTLLLLIEFEGVPDLQNDKELDDLRFSYLKELVFAHPAKSLLIVSDHHPRNYRLRALFNELKDEGRFKLSHTLVNIPSIKTTMEEINNIAHEKGFNIENVLVAGCNTSGCVFDSLPYSAKWWAKAGHFTQIILPMCGDYEVNGVGPEKYMKSFANLHNKIKQASVFRNTEVIADLSRVMYYVSGQQLSRKQLSGKKGAKWQLIDVPSENGDVFGELEEADPNYGYRFATTRIE